MQNTFMYLHKYTTKRVYIYIHIYHIYNIYYTSVLCISPKNHTLEMSHSSRFLDSASLDLLLPPWTKSIATHQQISKKKTEKHLDTRTNTHTHTPPKHFKKTCTPSKIEWDLTNGPLSKLRSSYEILRFFRGPLSGSCWRFLGCTPLKKKTYLVELCQIYLPEKLAAQLQWQATTRHGSNLQEIEPLITSHKLVVSTHQKQHSKKL